ncbi:MAG: excinuclease ABC subunit UvrA [Acidiferrobacterales bacterium]
MGSDWIRIRGARQNNLKNLNLRLPLNELVVVTGVSGCGKSSLAFDTIFAEGQRRYVETFSPYARQFLDRMDRPQVDAIDGIPPAIAIDQINPVRTSRSTVGTMTELNDHLKLLFARAARLHCRKCGRPVMRDTPDSIYARLQERTCGRSQQVLITFSVKIPENFSENEVAGLLAAQGYTRVRRCAPDILEVIQDRILITPENRARLVDDLEAALKAGRGRVSVHPLGPQGEENDPWRFSSGLHCADCDIEYHNPVPNLFSFNSPIGACPACRGFGRIIGIDYNLVVPDESRTLAGGAIKPWQTESYRECQSDLLRFARKRKIPTDVPWSHLSPAQRQWVLEGEGAWEEAKWYGVRRFFEWLETKSYRMHIRVLLSKYRAYTVCPDCGGARLKPEALLWRLGTDADAAHARSGSPASGDHGGAVPLPGLTLRDITLLPLGRCREFFAQLCLGAPLDEATELLLGEVRTRLAYLVEVGLGYLTLDRQSRTLSGGEVQRINLTTALGTSLVNALFVLDEPSIGLHARDVQRLMGVLNRLRDAGNSLLVVEHDPQVMLGADRILDLGPGPGEHGGRVVFFGTPAALLRSRRSLTARYLRGEKSVAPEEIRPTGNPNQDAAIEILGATENNLRNIDVRIPLNRLVCITGVSGSGKSTLMVDVCFNALRKLKGHAADPAGHHRELRGHAQLHDVVLVDQSPIGKTSRSNPATYVGALDPIRRLFAGQPLAKQRGYTASTFSFNAGTGRCPTCQGSGFEHVEMQFLSDVYIRCPDCDGRRYRNEVLEVKLFAQAHSKEPAARNRKGRPLRSRAAGTAMSIADVLDMTASEAIGFFSEHTELQRVLEPLAAVGLSYLKLGQPVPTLSGGEAQRLKLAGHLAEARRRRDPDRSILFLFDEPTTGLHFDDIATLLRAFRRLLDEGHSVVVIEHNLDVIRSADWIIDLGPEGGDDGGTVICTGTAEQVSRHPTSHTGKALREHLLAPGHAGTAQLPDRCLGNDALVAAPRPAHPDSAIRIWNAREHNLKGIDLAIPRDCFTVITGISGSGKSTVAFDILFAEGQRRYLESLNAYARQFVQPAARPDVDAIRGIPPTVAIEQRTSRGGRKSTVGTLTEIHHFLRLLFVKLGVQHCPDCRVPIESQTAESILGRILRDYRGHRVTLLAPLVMARKGYYTDLAQWAYGKGHTRLRVDGTYVGTADWPRLDRFREHDIELPVDEMEIRPDSEERLRAALEHALALGKGNLRLLPEPSRKKRLPDTPVLFSTNRACSVCGRGFDALDPRLFSYNSKHGWCKRCYGTGVLLPGFDADQSGEEIWWNEWWEGEERTCPDCGGQRLNPVALAVRFQNRSIAEFTAMPASAAARLFGRIRLTGRAAAIARDILAELGTRLGFLMRVGLGYLTLDRAAPTLSGGEAQRIRLAAQLGSNLRGVCYILDEPTIGLHPHDNRMLLGALQALRRNGNTLLVVEHDEETIRKAQHVIDLGPGAGIDGGHVVAEGTLDVLLANPESVTGRCLANPMSHPLFQYRPVRFSGRAVTASIKIEKARLNNLKNLNARIPLGRLVCVTGISGSGKSTLVRQILYENLRRVLPVRSGRIPPLRGCRAIRGIDSIGRVLEVDQTPIGKTPRSCPATYVGFWDQIRRLFSATVESRLRGYSPARFSFNTPGGRCETCEGQGVKKIEMNFLPDVTVACEACAGARFGTETLMVRFKDRNIAEVLAMSIDDATEFFAAQERIHRALRLLQDVGLGYLTLGQPSPTLSGGEAQRIKLVTELAKNSPAARLRSGSAPATTARHTLYILDEPTVGLHMADVDKLIHVLHRLVASGNTVVVIEHNLDIIAEADWIIDLGPEGGDSGGRIVAQGAPDVIVHKHHSHTARALAGFLHRRSTAARRRMRGD